MGTVCLGFSRRGPVLGRGHVGVGGDDQRRGVAGAGKAAVRANPRRRSLASDNPSLFLGQGLQLRQQHGPPAGPLVERGRR